MSNFFPFISRNEILSNTKHIFDHLTIHVHISMHFENLSQQILKFLHNGVHIVILTVGSFNKFIKFVIMIIIRKLIIHL